MRNDLYVIKMCLAKLYSKKDHEQRTFFVSAQHRKLYMKTYEGFHFADDTNLPQNFVEPYSVFLYIWLWRVQYIAVFTLPQWLTIRA